MGELYGSPTVRPVDLEHLGVPRVICAWLVDDVIVDPGPATGLPRLLEAVGESEPRAVLLTHIHLDHAGATGSLVRRWPGVRVYVHERGARHLVDPSKLLASAARLYGEDMDRLWGEVLPVPQANVVALTGEEGVPGFRTAHAPGHASHHLLYLHEETGRAFTGDVAGVRIPPHDLVLAPTPPPDIDPAAWGRSLDLLASWEPTSLALTHFGPVEDPGPQIEGVRRWLAEFAPLARDGDQAAFEAAVRARIAARTGSGDEYPYAWAAPLDQLYLGLRRHWDRHAA